MSGDSAPDLPSLLRLDGRAYQVVGRVLIGGKEHFVCAPVKGRGQVRAVPVPAVETVQNVGLGSASNGRAYEPGNDHAKAAERQGSQLTAMAAVRAQVRATLQGRPGKVGWAVITWLLGVIAALAWALD